ncbi:helix-turn-helix domain-containing protein [Methylobacterium platani]|nr:helix-turn-helix domain-containing protein [Methylobacterium platani]
MIGDHFMPIDCRQMGDAVFKAHLEAASIGGMTVTRATVSGQSVNLTSEAASRGNKHDKLTATIRLSGTTRSSQNDRAAISHAGDVIVFDGRAPLAFEHTELTSSVTIELPRERIESVLGPASRFAGLNIGRDLPETTLVQTFFSDLIGMHEQLGPDIADRMAGIGADLIVAGLAARLGRGTPRDLQGNVTVQRAKAYVSANLSDPTLDPARIAAAVGVSLPHLQHLFHERGRDVPDWLRQRRLALAARRLTDPRYAHLSIAALAERCGFPSPTRFSRQFRGRFDVPPGEYRRASLQSIGRSTTPA